MNEEGDILYHPLVPGNFQSPVSVASIESQDVLDSLMRLAIILKLTSGFITSWWSTSNQETLIDRTLPSLPNGMHVYFYPNTLPFRTHTPVPSVFIFGRCYCMVLAVMFIHAQLISLAHLYYRSIYPMSYMLLSVATDQRDLHSMCLLLSSH